MKMPKGALEWGVWIWGGLVILLTGLILLFLLFAACDWINPSGSIYQTFKTFGTLVGAIVGFSGVAWTQFFIATRRKPGSKGGAGAKPFVAFVGGVGRQVSRRLD